MIMKRAVQRWHMGCLLAAAMIFLAAFGPASGDVIIFKDGFTIHGKLKEDTTVIFEGGMAVPVKRIGGFFTMDDEARRVIFSPKSLHDVQKRDADLAGRDLRFENTFRRIDNFNLPAGRYGDITPWNGKWDRILKIDDGKKEHDIAQHLSILTPYFARVDARRYRWSPHYLTSELDPAEYREILYQHPTLKLKGDKDDPPKRFRVVSFMVQAGWYEYAIVELEAIIRSHPEQKEKAVTVREKITQILQAQLVDLIEKANKAGRHNWAQTRLANLPTGLAAPLLLRCRAVEAEYASLNKRVEDARRFLTDLPERVQEGDSRQLLVDAAATILRELHLDSAGRLDTFISFALQAERERKLNRTPGNTPEQLLALAITGWSLGSAAADTKVEMAVKLWQTRDFLLSFQKSHDALERPRLVAAFEKKFGLPYDELARMINLLPPPEPFEQTVAGSGLWELGMLPFPQAALTWVMATVQRNTPSPQLRVRASLPWSARKGPTYHVQLPPEYHPSRSYPVLVVLSEAGHKPEEFMKRLSFHAALNGFILAAPEWHSGKDEGYGFSLTEHRAALDTIRDMRQRFAVDSDKVFLFGMGEGGSMAYDVGLSHPDQFAGVIPMGGKVKYFSKKYRANNQYLPFYVVDGDMAGESVKESRGMFEYWVPKGFPAISVMYKGRGQEWFNSEVPIIFDWMNRKKRVSITGDVLKMGGDEFQSMRSTDDRFYWIKGEGLGDRFTNDAKSWTNKIQVGATLQAKVSEGNQINVTAHGWKRATIWLAPGMIDFEKTAMIYVNSQIGLANRKIKPSLITLLDDFYVNGDRQRVFVAKVEVTP